MVKKITAFLLTLMISLVSWNGVAAYADTNEANSEEIVNEETSPVLANPDFTLKSYGKGQVILSYKKILGVKGAEVYLKVGKDKKWDYLGTIDNHTAKYYFKGVKKGKTCYFKLISYKTDKNDKKYRSEPVVKSVKVTYKSVKMRKGNYTKGSVYGPSLTVAELKQVKKQVQKFLDENIVDTMSDYEKVAIAHDYLVENCDYADSWKKNNANSAWGALVYHEAQCSGYARAYKALCDAMGIGCYYVHANAKSINPSHQFNMVRVDKKWYIIDVQANDSSGFDVAFLCSAKQYKELGIRWDESKFSKCKNNYIEEQRKMEG